MDDVSPTSRDRFSLSRRDLLKLTAFGTAALSLPLMGPLSAKQASEVARSEIPRPFTRPFRFPDLAVPTRTLDDGRLLFTMEQKPFDAQILNRLKTRMIGYNGTFPGPTIAVRRNPTNDVSGRIVVRQINSLASTPFGVPAETSTHLHGAPSKPQFDGYANDLTAPGQAKNYEYDNTEDARTLWYHDHAVHFTARNVYHGLAGLYVNRDTLDDKLPSGEFDLPLVISDAAFQANGNLLFDDRGHSGVNGDVIMVNGVPWPVHGVKPRRYRLRILGASTARAYRLYLTRNLPFTVISNDGGFLRAPVQVAELPLAMAERYGAIVDFRGLPKGTRVELRNRGVPNSIDYDDTDKVMAFQIIDDDPTPDVGPLPPFATDGTVLNLKEADSKRTRELRFERSNGEWQINQKTWEEVADNRFDPTLFDGTGQPGDIPEGDVEIWKLVNKSGGWFHPIHIHLVDFRILTRNGRPPAPFESGPKDVVYLRENEEVRVIAKFGGDGVLNRTGRYMLHCHNTSHEDFDMMHQFRVGADTPDNNPLSATPETA